MAAQYNGPTLCTDPPMRGRHAMPDTRSPPVAEARTAVRALVASQIREVANAGMGDPDILTFWFGEPDEVTPAFIRDAAVPPRSPRGETFYTQNFGIPPLRECARRIPDPAASPHDRRARSRSPRRACRR